MVHYKTKPDSWLYSDSLLRRSFAIWGHNMIAHLIIMLIFWVIIAIVAFTFVSTFRGVGPANGQNQDRNDYERFGEYDAAPSIGGEL